MPNRYPDPRTFGTTTADGLHVDAIEAGSAADVDPGLDRLPAPTVREPVAIGAAGGIFATVGVLIAQGVPWPWALTTAVLLTGIGAWQRGRVMPL